MFQVTTFHQIDATADGTLAVWIDTFTNEADRGITVAGKPTEY